MSLRSKVIVTLVVVFSGFIAADYAVQRLVIYPNFLALERDKAVADLGRCQDAIKREIEHLSLYCRDWSSWDDTYRYIQDENAEYAASNLNTNTLNLGQMDMMFIWDLQGRVLWSLVLDSETREPMSLEGFPPDVWPVTHPFVAGPVQHESVEGLAVTARGPLLLVSHPVLPSEGDAAPRGGLMFGRFLDAEAVRMLAEQTRVELRIWPTIAGSTVDPVTPQEAPGSQHEQATASPAANEALPAAEMAALQRMPSARHPLIEPQDHKTLAAYSLMSDFTGHPALLLRADIPRQISTTGQAVMRFAVISLGGAGIVTLTALILLLQRIVIGPVVGLTRHVTTIGASGDLTYSLNLQRHDEIGILAREFDGMVRKLAEWRAQLTESSRHAGMAEVAANVLHNVGNVLNSVKIAAATASSQVRDSKAPNLARAVDLMRTHSGDLGAFLSADERGRQLPAYLAQLADCLQHEQADLLRELSTLDEQVEHINQVIQAQQAFARARQHVEPTSLSELAGSAVLMLEAAFRRHGVRVERDFADLPAIPLDRSKALQVLVNLLTNAKEALGQRDQADRRIVVRVRGQDAGRASIQVIDNGPGIAPGDLTRIFAGGYSSKGGNRGCGLHWSALAAREMNGNLSVHSDGPGTGATFTLELPVESVPRPVRP